MAEPQRPERPWPHHFSRPTLVGVVIFKTLFKKPCVDLEFAILVRVVKPSIMLCAEFKLAEVCTLMTARAGISVAGMPEVAHQPRTFKF